MKKMGNREVVVQQEGTFEFYHDKPITLWRRLLTLRQLKSLVEFGESFGLYPLVISDVGEDGLTVQITEGETLSKIKQTSRSLI